MGTESNTTTTDATTSSTAMTTTTSSSSSCSKNDNSAETMTLMMRMLMLGKVSSSQRIIPHNSILLSVILDILCECIVFLEKELLRMIIGVFCCIRTKPVPVIMCRSDIFTT